MKTFSNRTGAFRGRSRALATALALSVGAGAAHAVLGGNVSTIDKDVTRLNGERRQPLMVRNGTQSHEITMADGSSIREYVNDAGIVFAVSWSTRFKPNLTSLLGEHVASYDAAASQALARPGIQRNVTLQQGDLVVQSAVHLNSFVGVAYLRSLLPEGVRANELR